MSCACAVVQLDKGLQTLRDAHGGSAFDLIKRPIFEKAQACKLYKVSKSTSSRVAQITNAKFLFLTYGAGGGPGYDTDHHVDDYSVLSLDQLVVRIVEEELAFVNLWQ